MYFARAHARKIPVRDLALPMMRDRDGERRYKAAASRLRRNSKAPFAKMCPTEFPERASRASNASFEMQLLLLAMFQVSVSWVEFPFIYGGIRISNASKVLKS